MTDWLWYPYVACKEVTLVEGDPAGGKSWLTQVLGKHACDGELRELPSPKPTRSSPDKLKVLAFDADNSIDTVTIARLKWAGCKNLQNYFQKEEAFSIEEHYAQVAAAVMDTGAGIVIFDIVHYYLVGDSAKPDIAAPLSLFKKLARECNCAVILVRWLTKARGDGRAIHAGQGNVAFSGIVSIQITVSRMPDEPDTPDLKHRAFAVPKCRLSLEPPPHDFYIRSKPTVADPDRAETEFGEYLDDVTADDLTARPSSRGAPPESIEAASEFLRSELERAGSMPVKQLMERAERRSISGRTLRRAAAQLGVVKTGAKGRTEISKWSLPNE